MTQSTHPSKQTAFRAQLLTFNGDPAQSPDAAVFHEDGLLLVEDGRVVAAGAYAALASRLAPGVEAQDMRDKLIVPGFIDTHIHFPQTDMIASPAPGLLPWLDTYTFPTERSSPIPTMRARRRELLHRRTARVRHHHRDRVLHRPSSIRRRVLRRERRTQSAHGGGQGADGPQLPRVPARHRANRRSRQRRADRPLAQPRPPAVRDHAAFRADFDRCATRSRAACWRGSIPTCSSRPMSRKTLTKWNGSTQLFPEARSYLDVYDHYGMLRRARCTAIASGFDDADRARMAQTGALASHCPTSNLFLGSGLFDFDKADAARHADCAGDRRRRRHLVLDAANDE